MTASQDMLFDTEQLAREAVAAGLAAGCRPEDGVGDAAVPTVKVGKQTFRGFDASAYGNLLDLAGYPKSAPYGAQRSTTAAQPPKE